MMWNLIVFYSTLIVEDFMDSLPDTSFRTEAALVASFVAMLESEVSPWGHVSLTTEWDYGAGYTDVLARTTSGQLVAFEGKLTDWKTAFYQAYRNTSFASLAYVVMPRRGAGVAARHADLFAKQGVGLCCVDGGEVTVVIAARPRDALLPRRRDEALTFLEGRKTSARYAFEGGRQPNLRLASIHA